ncbi:MAG: DUF302 domain-containing protein [Candidatus Aminicenantes bacterium]|nr:DUF302 domain-containing protein [Candidatus Aminicenantes bacterium]
MTDFDYTVSSDKSFDQAVEAVLAKAKEKGFGVLHVHDVQATLSAKGFARGPLKIIEVCHPRHAYDVLEKDVKIALMLPCPISVHAEAGRTTISTLRPKMISQFYPGVGIEETAAAVDQAVLEIVDESK